MEKVEIVIKIPKYYLTHPQDYTCLAECVRRGVPLPKGHGRLIDADEVTRNCLKHAGKRSLLIDLAPTVIEADKGGMICG